MKIIASLYVLLIASIMLLVLYSFVNMVIQAPYYITVMVLYIIWRIGFIK